MRNSFRTTIGQFSNAGGRFQPRAANVRAVEPAPGLAGAERGNLYMLVEVSGSGGGHAALYRQMLNAAQTAFYEAEGSVSSALVRAVRNAHAVLRRANEALPEAGWRAGMTCVALHGQELMIAQAGPALVLVGHPRTIDQFPDRPLESSSPLGGEERPEVELVRTSIEPGSLILVVQSDWLKEVSPEALAAATTAEEIAQVLEYLGQLAGEAELSALAIAVDSALPEVQEQSTPPGVSAKSHPATLAKQFLTPPVLQDQAAGALVHPAAPVEAAPVTPARKPREGFFRAPFSKPAEPVEPAAELTPPREPAKPEPITFEPEPAEDFEREERPRRSVWPLVLALVVIPLLIAALVLGMWWMRNQKNETQFQQLLQGASTAVAEAQGLPDEGNARLRLNDARALLDKAAVLKPGDSRQVDAEAKYIEIADRVNHVTPLYGVVPLWEFKGDGQRLDRVLVNSTALFVLDRGRQEVSHFLLSELGDNVTPAQPAIVISKTQRLADQVIGDLVDMTWMDAVNNQHSRLLVLDASGGLFGYDMTWADSVPVAGREQWGYPQLIAGYNTNLYILDTKANQIWRYRPADKGYEKVPEPYFAEGTRVDLAGVQSVAIDGSIWLLYADGRLLKFNMGEQKAFELSGLVEPLNSPMAVVTSAEGDELYIADSGNGRIVEFTKEGQFQRQFRPKQGSISFKGMRGLFLDEATSVFYILVGNKLYKADLPRPSSMNLSIQ